MILSRRRVLFGLVAAPAVITTLGLLMPVRSFVAPPPRFLLAPVIPKAMLDNVARLYGIERLPEEVDFSLRERLLPRMLSGPEQMRSIPWKSVTKYV